MQSPKNNQPENRGQQTQKLATTVTSFAKSMSCINSRLECLKTGRPPKLIAASQKGKA